MKLSNERIVNSVNVLNLISQKQLPIKVSYAIAKNISKLEVEIKVYNEERQKLIDKYSIKDQDGKTLVEGENIRIAQEYIEDWKKDIEELLSIENEIDIRLIDLDDLLNTNCDFTPSELIQIDYMIEE